MTFAFLESIPARETIRQRLTELWDYEKYGAPFKEGGRYYYMHNSGLQNQSVLFTMDTLKSKPRVLLDPNTWSEDGTVALAGMAFSDDGKYMAYGVQDGGSDWRTWRFMEIDSQKILDDELKWIKFSGVSWTKDGKGLFYSRYDEPQEGEQFQSLNLNQKVYYHRVGTPQTEDVLVFCRPDHPEWGFQAEVTEDGDYLVITVWKGTDDKYRVFYKDLNEPYGMPIELIDNFDNEYSFVGNDGQVFYFQTDVDAARKRLIAIDIKKPQRDAWKEIIPQTENVLRGVGFVGDLFIAQYLKDAQTQVVLYTPQGERVENRGVAGDRHGVRVRRQTNRYRDVLFVFKFRGAAQHLSVRPEDTKESAAATGEGEIRSGRVRNQADFLCQQRRYESAHVHHCQERDQTGWAESNVALRVRRLQYTLDARRSRSVGWLGWKWVGCWPSPTCAVVVSMVKSGIRREPS